MLLFFKLQFTKEQLPLPRKKKAPVAVGAANQGQPALAQEAMPQEEEADIEAENVIHEQLA